MEPTQGLIVALMFITLLSIGLGNLVMHIAATFRGHRPGAQGVVLIWELLLILMHFNLVWHTLEIFGRENWTFFAFLLMELGPILLIISVEQIGQVTGEPSDAGGVAYLEVSKRFFFSLVLLHLWAGFVDYWFGGLSVSTFLNVGFAVFLAAMMGNTKSTHHRFGAAAGLVLFLGVRTARELSLL